jgi:protein involved in temperature-dependent protein secretion
MPRRGAAIGGGGAGNEGNTVTAEPTLNDAHRLLREGRVDSAIDAYTALLKDRPDDWTTANRLGDLYVQTGQMDAAVEQFSHVAHCLVERNLLPKAAALYKKVLKVVPGDESTRSQLVDLALRQGFLVEAIGHLTAMAEQRRASGDDAGALEVQHRIDSLRRPAPDATEEAPDATEEAPAERVNPDDTQVAMATPAYGP